MCYHSYTFLLSYLHIYTFTGTLLVQEGPGCSASPGHGPAWDGHRQLSLFCLPGIPAPLRGWALVPAGTEQSNASPGASAGLPWSRHTSKPPGFQPAWARVHPCISTSNQAGLTFSKEILSHLDTQTCMKEKREEGPETAMCHSLFVEQEGSWCSPLGQVSVTPNSL